MENKRETVNSVMLYENETFAAYSNQLNKSLLVNLEENKVVPYPLNTANMIEILDVCHKGGLPTTIVFQDVEQEKVYLTLSTCMDVTCVIQIEDNQITIEKVPCDLTLDDEDSNEAENQDQPGM